MLRQLVLFLLGWSAAILSTGVLADSPSSQIKAQESYVGDESRSETSTSQSNASGAAETLDEAEVFERAKVLYYDKSDPDHLEKSFELLMTIATRGHAKAQLNVGMMYRDGRGVKRDYASAVVWLTKAAKQNEPEAAFLLGLLLERGVEGVPVDRPGAYAWIEKAAELGSAQAQGHIGFRLLNGGSAADLTRAAEWLTKAAEQGHQHAQVQIAAMYREGQGVEKDERIAFAWYQKAADRGLSHGQIGLAHMYRTGTVVEKDAKKAFALYEEASTQAEAVYYQGLMVLEGDGVKQDGLRARDLILEAAKRGHADAQILIGELYRTGSGGFLQDYREAANWYTLAAKQGDTSAQHGLAVMYWRGQGVAKARVTAYAWINLASRTNDKNPKDVRAKWAQELSEAELEQAQTLSREWRPYNSVPVIPDG